MDSAAIHNAAWTGKKEKLEVLLINLECNINIRDEDGKTPLHRAASGGHTQCVQLLLQHGADPNIQDRVEKNSSVWSIISHQMFSTAHGDGKTPLHWAASGGHTQCAQLLLQHGADPNIKDQVGHTPLHWAACQGNTKCVQLLLQHGADPNIQNLTKKRPSMLAEEGCHDDIAQLLRRFELPTIQAYMQSRILQHQSLNSLGYLKSQEGQKLKDWAIKNEYTTFRDFYVGLRAENSQLSDAAMEQYVEVLTEISNMSSDAFETLCRTFDAAVCIFTPSSSTTGLQEKSLPLDHYRHDAFIAYSSEDKATIEPVLHQLKECGIECFYAKEDLALGTYVITSIIEAVSSSRHTIVFLSKSFIQSDWCQLELQYIIQNATTSKGHVVIPVVMKMAPEEVPRELSIWKYILFDDEELIPKLLQAIKGAAVEYYAEVVTNVSNMSPDGFESVCRTLPSDKYMYTQSSTTHGFACTSLPLDHHLYDAFIAYSGEDEATIEPVLHQLKECEIQCFYAKEDLELGTYLIHSISRAVRSSKHTIVFLSKSFIHSRWCQVELEHAMKNAIQLKKNVIPVVLNISTREIPSELKGLKYLFLDDEELIPKLVEAIKGPRELRDDGKLRDENKQLRYENKQLRDEVQQLTGKLRPQSE